MNTEPKFLIQRPEYPAWYAGKNEHGGACWASERGDAQFVRLDELAAVLYKLAVERPVAILTA